MAAGIGLLLGGIHLLIWRRLKSQPEQLCAAIMGLAAGLVALSETMQLAALTPQEYQKILEFQNVGVGVMLVAMVWFVYFRLRSRRRWLAGTITAIWIFCIAVNLIFEGNLTFSSLDRLSTHVTSWGEPFTLPAGTPNPWADLANFATMLIIVFVIDAIVTALRRGDKRRAIAVGGPILLFILVAGIHTPLVDLGIVQTPYAISLVFVAIALSLALGLVAGVAQTAGLTAQLGVERKRWDDVLENINLAVSRVDCDGRIAYVNPFFERLSGRTGESMIGLQASELLEEDERRKIKEVLLDADKWTTRSYSLRRMLTSSGDTRDLICFSVSLRTTDGKPDGVITFGQDVTEQRKAERERDANRQSLEKLTRILTMGELSSSLAHELSQPIAAILTNAQTLEIIMDATREPDRAGIVDDIISDARRARDLMDGVRKFVVDEKPQKEWFDVSSAIDEVVSMVRGDLDRHQVNLVSKNNLGDPHIFAARIEIQQIVMNLVMNAIQSVGVRQGGIVKIFSEVTPSGDLSVAVEDNGPGIPVEQRMEVFEPFVTSKRQGTGIGLAVSRRIASRHEGDIQVSESTLGGARFILTLPYGHQRESLAASG